MRKYSVGANELDEFYQEPPWNDQRDRLREHIKATLQKMEQEGASLPTQKAAMHHIIAEQCDVKVFPHVPFFWEVCVGRDRRNWGTYSQMANYFLHHNATPNLQRPYGEEVKRFEGIFCGWNPVGYDHHCPGYDKILQIGLNGIIAEAEERLTRPVTPEQASFLEATIASNRAVIRLAERFSEEAERMLLTESDPAAQKNLRNIAINARQVPANPPKTFHQALNCILFVREIIGSLESFGVSTFGQLDRMLFPFYDEDLTAGRITSADAKELIHALLAFTDAKFNFNDGSGPETSTTLVIGGCDAAGAPVCNPITNFVVDACIENGYVGTKIIARISSQHPKEYYDLLAKFVNSRSNVLVMPNDDTLIPAQRRWNKRLEDARLYVGGGCHEVVLGGTEVCTRADSWINLPGLMMRSLFDDERTPELQTCQNPENYEAFYWTVLGNIHHFYSMITSIKESYERHWGERDATPFYSSTLSDCIENAKDLTVGGARYNSVSLSMLGAGTLLDSLYTIKRLVFDEQRYTFSQFLEIISHNYDGYEVLRQEMIHKFPRHGQANPEFDAFAAKILRDLSCVAGQPNGRGGIVTPAFYPHDLYLGFGASMGATPDGRRAGMSLSRGFAPSETTEIDSVTDIIRSLKAFDLSLFPESFATEITLPVTLGPQPDNAVAALILGFAESGGSTLQINVFDHDDLVRARKNPEEYPNLIVRVCGYSQAFNSLSGDKKDELIQRATRNF